MNLLCFYNDAYRLILGYRLPTALSRPFPEVWASIWEDIGPLVEAKLTGKRRIMTDVELDLSRAGRPEPPFTCYAAAMKLCRLSSAARLRQGAQMSACCGPAPVAWADPA